MNKRILCLFCIPVFAVAAESYEPGDPLTPIQEAAADAEARAEGWPAPDSGLQIVPASQSISQAQSPIRKQYLRNRKIMEKQGYVNEASSDAQSLLAMQIPANLKKYELSKHLSDVKLAFPFSAPTFIPEQDILGYGGFITYDNGWTGIALFFKDEHLGVCRYGRHNMKLTHGGARLLAEDLEYDVNQKPSDKMVKGNAATGYSYDISWYDDTYIHTLECASERFNPEGINRLIHLAKDFDHIL